MLNHTLFMSMAITFLFIFCTPNVVSSLIIELHNYVTSVRKRLFIYWRHAMTLKLILT
jgi:hypothetical protein